MADMLGTGLSSLRALQRALDTTAHNIANVSTEGYTRQRVDLPRARRSPIGTNWIGSGVDAVQVRRVYDQFLSEQVRSRSGTLARLDAFASQAERLDNLLGDSSNGLSASLQGFTDAVNEVSSTPSSISARQVLLAQGRAWSTGCRDTTARCATCLPTSTRALPAKPARSIVLAQGFARLNGDIAVAVSRPANRPTTCSTSATAHRRVVREGGRERGGREAISLNVFIGNGQPLVLGTTASQITTRQDPLDPDAPAARAADRRRHRRHLAQRFGGTVGGLLDWRREMLDPARNELGRITLAVATQVNAQHREGMDLTGALGGDFFNIGAVA
jgi:flagellar hook-associated protein 1 FlgK